MRNSGLLLLASLMLAACQSSQKPDVTTPPTPLSKAEAGVIAAQCALVADLNKKMIAAQQPVPESNDCAYFAQHGTLKGYSEDSRQPEVPIMPVSGGISLNIAALRQVPDNLRAIERYRRAKAATVPQNVVAHGARTEEFYRKLIARGYPEDIIDGVTKTPQFSKVVAAYKHYDDLKASGAQ